MRLNDFAKHIGKEHFNTLLKDPASLTPDFVSTILDNLEPALPNMNKKQLHALIFAPTKTLNSLFVAKVMEYANIAHAEKSKKSAHTHLLPTPVAPERRRQDGDIHTEQDPFNRRQTISPEVVVDCSETTRFSY